MQTLLFILQAKEVVQDTGVSDVAAIIGIVITALMLIGGIYVVFKYPIRGTGMLLGSILMMLPFTGIILVAYSNLAKFKFPDGAWFAVPAAWVFWVILFIFAYATIRRDARPAERHEVFDQQADQQPGAATPHEFSAEDVIDAAEPVVPEHTPRRAVSIPSADSDSGRASEQTLKRMTLEKLESSSSAPKPPRASEIPENPILPDEVCKVRCLACDKKMQAEGAKFMKQRRCPNCKAEPFRYVTAV